VFDASLYPADALRPVTDLRRQLVANQLEELCRLGHARDVELLFARGYCRPAAVGKFVREIFDLSHDVARWRLGKAPARFCNVIAIFIAMWHKTCRFPTTLAPVK
jgi:hypothetical protein